MSVAKNWKTLTESRYPWERDALKFIRERFPSHEPYRAWANFEFIADDGSINEVDLLAFTPQGFFLVEIKSRTGRLWGDAGTWIWETEGHRVTMDNPLIAANQKAKKLSSLLQRRRAVRKKGGFPSLRRRFSARHFEGVGEEARRMDKTIDEIKGWQPPKRTRKRAGRASKKGTATA